MCVCLSVCPGFWACWLCSPRWNGCTPQLSLLCSTVCSNRLRYTAITSDDPPHPRGVKVSWIHTSNHLKFPPTLSMSHLKCRPNSYTSRLPSPWSERETVSMETTSGSLFFFFAPELRALSCLYFLLLKYRSRESVCVCVCVFMHSYESIFAVCVCETAELCVHVWMSQTVIFFDTKSNTSSCPRVQHEHRGAACVFGCLFVCICAGVSLDMKSNCDSSALDDSSPLSHKVSLTNRQPRTETMNSSDSQRKKKKYIYIHYKLNKKKNNTQLPY